MALTLMELEARLHLLEEEMGRLRRKMEGPCTEETPAERGARMLQEARANAADHGQTPEERWHAMGHTGSPPTMEELRAMAAVERRRAERKKVRAANGPPKARSRKG